MSSAIVFSCRKHLLFVVIYYTRVSILQRREAARDEIFRSKIPASSITGPWALSAVPHRQNFRAYNSRHCRKSENDSTGQASPDTPNLASIPYRFKAGASGSKMAPMDGHHHRSTTKVSHKPFKSRHASKGALKEKSKGAHLPLHLFLFPGSLRCEITCANTKPLQQQAKSKAATAESGARRTSRSCRSWTGATRRSRSG